MSLQKSLVAWITAIASGSAGSGVSGADTVTARFSPVRLDDSTRIQILSASGCDKFTANQWFILAIDIQNKGAQLDADERMFIRNVINRLTVSADAIPTPDHKIWLCNLKKRLGL